MEIDKDVEKVLNPINEMAKIADIDKPVAIYVYSDDHNPSHFHLGISGGESIRIAIPDVSFETQEQLKNLVLPADKNKINSYQKYFTNVIETLKRSSSRSSFSNLSNLQVLQGLWELWYETNNWTDVNSIL